MLKPVKSVIASSRALLRGPSEVRLPTSTMKLMLPQYLEELHALCLQENSDFFTHDLELTLTYDETLKGYTYVVDPGVEGENIPAVTEIIPVYLRFQPTTADPDEDAWTRVTVSKLTSFSSDKPPGVVSCAHLGNNWQGLNAPQFKFNVTQDFIADNRWRICCRIFPPARTDSRAGTHRPTRRDSADPSHWRDCISSTPWNRACAMATTVRDHLRNATSRAQLVLAFEMCQEIAGELGVGHIDTIEKTVYSMLPEEG